VLTRPIARTTSRPVTRISPGSGDSLPTPHPRAWYEARRSCPLEQCLYLMRPDQPASQETLISVPKPRRNTDVRGRGPGTPGHSCSNSTTSHQPPAPAGPGAGRTYSKFAMRTSNEPPLLHRPNDSGPGRKRHLTDQITQSPVHEPNSSSRAEPTQIPRYGTFKFHRT
jgi:hypothetical protein